VTAGTIFHGSRLPLTSWFAAIWYVVNQKQGVSALGLQQVLGFGSYQTAWAWLHKLRRAMVLPGRELLSGAVEVDESYIGGVKPGKRGRGAHGKAIVVIAVERDGRGPGRVRIARAYPSSRRRRSPTSCSSASLATRRSTPTPTAATPSSTGSATAT
jgi:ISXO2-like transposase domain